MKEYYIFSEEIKIVITIVTVHDWLQDRNKDIAIVDTEVLDSDRTLRDRLYLFGKVLLLRR